VSRKVVLLELDYSIEIRLSNRGHYYILKNVLILRAISVLFCTMELFKPLDARSRPNSWQAQGL
jgi:hypothetical protein